MIFFFSVQNLWKKNWYYAGVSSEWCFHTWNVWCFHTCFHILLPLRYSIRNLWSCKAGMMLEDCWGWRKQNLVPWCLYTNTAYWYIVVSIFQYCLLQLIPAWAIPPATLRHHFPKNRHKPKQPGNMLAIKQYGWPPGQCSSLFLALVLFSSMEELKYPYTLGLGCQGNRKHWA